MTLQSSSAKSRQSSVDLTTMKTLSLESDSLTIYHLVDLLILILDIRGAWPVPLVACGSALGFMLSTSTSTGTGSSTITITSKVDRRSGTTAKELLLPCEEVLFIISNPPHQPNLIVDGHAVAVIRHRQRLVRQRH